MASFADDFGVAYDTVRRWGNDYGVPRWATRVLALMDQHGRPYVAGPRSQRLESAADPAPAPVKDHLTPAHQKPAAPARKPKRKPAPPANATDNQVQAPLFAHRR
jgi:hypothetical protein